MTKEKIFKVGDKVKAVKASRGWGMVKKGDKGFITGVIHETYFVDFPKQKGWKASAEDLELVKITKNEKIKKLENEVKSLEEKIDSLEETTKKIPVLESEINYLKDRVEQLGKLIEDSLTQSSSKKEKESEIIEFKGKKFKKVNRKAKVGDVVIFKGDEKLPDTTIGKPYEIININSIGLKYYDDVNVCMNVYGWKFRNIEVHVYELVKPINTELIEKAKEFVRIKTECLKDSSQVEGGYERKQEENPNLQMWILKPEFEIKGNTIIARCKTEYGSEVIAEGIARCNPQDTFNEHIGKAIALGRAMGVDVGEFTK